jgi:hypothetical protein
MAVSVDIEAVKRRLVAERTGILEERRRLLEDTSRSAEAGVDDDGDTRQVDGSTVRSHSRSRTTPTTCSPRSTPHWRGSRPAPTATATAVER